MSAELPPAPSSAAPMLSARQAGLSRCTACGSLERQADSVCRRCGNRIHQRIPRSLQRTWALLIVGMMAYVPAMVLPVLHTRSFQGNTSDTILSGVWALVDDGSPFIALIIFGASVCIPIVKFLVIATLALSLQLNWSMSTHRQHFMHRVTELIGRWSMIDVYVIVLLTALIQLGKIVTVVPGPGIDAFAVSVIFTMLAASSLDSRLFWDNENDVKRTPG